MRKFVGVFYLLAVLFFPAASCAQKYLRPLSRAVSGGAEKTSARETVWRSFGFRPSVPNVTAQFVLPPDLERQLFRGVAFRANLVRTGEDRRLFAGFPGKKEVDAVIFDLDGTLLDSLSVWEHSGTNFLRTQGIEPPEGLDAELAKLSLTDGARLLKQRYHLPQTPEEILRLTLLPVRRRYYTDVALKPGVYPLLHRLKAQGVKLCVATASDRELAEAALKRTRVFDLFDFIITCDEVGAGKRSPAVYERALEKLGTDKARTLVAEDALYAIHTAKRAGFPTAGVADVHSAADGPEIVRTADYYVFSF